MYQKIYGPYFKKGRFHVHLYFLDGRRKYRTFVTDEEALEFIRFHERRVVQNPTTVGEAIAAYLETRVDVRESTRATLRFRLASLARGFENRPIQAFPARTAWAAVAKRESVDTQHGTRSAGSLFFRWCIKKGYMKSNPLEGIEIAGRKRRGKPQLRLDEARRFLDRALAIADGKAVAGHAGTQQRVGILGAATALLLGLRASEVAGCQIRDLDDGGNVLCVAESKTVAGIRRVAVPEILRVRLVKLAGDRNGTAQLFAGLTRLGLLYWTKRLCRELNIPEVTPHGLRGTHATASMQPHSNPHAVAAALGHTSFAVTERHYTAPGAVDAARHEAALQTLIPSKRPSKSFGRAPESLTPALSRAAGEGV